MTSHVDPVAVWARIAAHQGEKFHQIRGGVFTYRISSDSVWPDRTNRAIHRSQFNQALELVPLPNTVVVHHLQGPSYIFAILMDPRIRAGDW